MSELIYVLKDNLVIALPGNCWARSFGEYKDE